MFYSLFQEERRLATDAHLFFFHHGSNPSDMVVPLRSCASSGYTVPNPDMPKYTAPFVYGETSSIPQCTHGTWHGTSLVPYTSLMYPPHPTHDMLNHRVRMISLAYILPSFAHDLVVPNKLRGNAGQRGLLLHSRSLGANSAA